MLLRPRHSRTALQLLTDEFFADGVELKNVGVLRAYVDKKWSACVPVRAPALRALPSLLRLHPPAARDRKRPNRYAEAKFHARLRLTVAFVLLFLAVVSTRRFEVSPATTRPLAGALGALGFGHFSECAAGGRLAACWAGIAGEVALIAGWAQRAIELGSMLLRDRVHFFKVRGATAFIDRVVGSGFVLTFAAALAVELAGHPLLSHGLFAVASALSWLQLFYFFLGFELTGPFIVMVCTMILKDFFIFTRCGARARARASAPTLMRACRRADTSHSLHTHTHLSAKYRYCYDHGLLAGDAFERAGFRL